MLSNYLIYTRVSTASQDDNTSISRQVEACVEYGNKQQWNKIEWVHDTLSGKKYDDRLGIQKVLSLVESGVVTEVICWSVDRTGREAVIIQRFFREIYELGGRVTIVTKGRTYKTFAEIRKDTLFDVAVAEYEHIQITDRMHNGKLFAFKELGSYIYSPVYGYTIESKNIDRNGHKVKYTYLVPNPTEAEFVTLACETFLSLGSLQKTSQYLNSQGIKTKKNGRFSTIQLTQILNRVAMYSGQPREESFGGHTRYMSYPAIISTDLAQRVMEALQTVSKKQDGSTTDTAPFTKLVTCSHCGRVAVANMGWRKGSSSKYGFICQSLRKERNERSKLGVSADYVSECRSQVAYNAILDTLTTFLKTANVEGIETQFEYELSKLLSEVKMLQLRLDTKVKERDDLKKRQTNIVNASLQLAGNDDFISMMSVYAEQVKQIQQQLEVLDRESKDDKAQLATKLQVFKSLGISLDTLEAMELKPTETVFTLGKPSHTTLLPHQNAPVSLLDAEAVAGHLDSLTTPTHGLNGAARQMYHAFLRTEAGKVRATLTQLQADIEAEDFSAVNLAMVKLGLRVEGDFSEQDRKARNAGLRVVVDFTAFESLLSASSTAKATNTTNRALCR